MNQSTVLSLSIYLTVSLISTPCIGKAKTKQGKAWKTIEKARTRYEKHGKSKNNKENNRNRDKYNRNSNEKQ